MNLFRCMEAFVKTDELGSMSAAARALTTTTSSISKKVTALEDVVGVTLIRRNARGMALTDAGRSYVQEARRILRDVQQLHRRTAAAAARPDGVLRVSAPLVFGRLFVAPALPDFLAAYPDVDVKLETGQDFVDLISSNIDVAIRIGALADADYVAAKLAPADRILCAAPAYLRRFGAPSTPGDLFKHNCLTSTLHKRRNTWFFRRDGEVHPATVSGSMRTDSSDALLTAAEQGVGIALLGEWQVFKQVRVGALVPLLTDWVADVSATPTNIHALFARTAYPTPKVRAFVDFIKNDFGAPPRWAVAPKDRGAER